MEFSEANYISQGKPETFSTEDRGIARKGSLSSLCSESDGDVSEGEDNVYVWCVDPLWRRRGCIQEESRHDESIEMVSEFCSNTGRRRCLRSSLGELCRVGTLGIVNRTKEEAQTKTCNYVYAKHEHKHGCDGSMYKMSEGSEQNESKGLGRVAMIVETFVDESVRRNITASVGKNLYTNNDLEKLDYFYEWIAKFGFDHIIVIGKVLYAGLLFLDCYGRVFEWEEMVQVLWPLGNSIEEVESRLKSNKRRDRVVWTAEYDGVMYQTLPDYDLEMAERARAEGLKNKNKKKNKKKKK